MTVWGNRLVFEKTMFILKVIVSVDRILLSPRSNIEPTKSSLILEAIGFKVEHKFIYWFSIPL